MSDEFDPVRRLRSDGLLPDDPPDLDVLTSSRRQLISDITGSTSDPRLPTPSIYPRLAYRDELAALEFWCGPLDSSSAARPEWSTLTARWHGSNSETG